MVMKKKKLIQKQWDNWSNEQFIYMKKWAREVAIDIVFDYYDSVLVLLFLVFL